MIPYNVAPTFYNIGFILIMAAIYMFVFSACTKKLYIGVIIAMIAIISALLFFIPVLFGSVTSQEIVICNHQLNNYEVMTVMDSYGDMYKIDDANIQLRVKDGVKTIVGIYTPFGGDSFIYKSDLPIICGNQTCGGVIKK